MGLRLGHFSTDAQRRGGDSKGRARTPGKAKSKSGTRSQISRSKSQARAHSAHSAHKGPALRGRSADDIFASLGDLVHEVGDAPGMEDLSPQGEVSPAMSAATPPSAEITPPYGPAAAWIQRQSDVDLKHVTPGAVLRRTPPPESRSGTPRLLSLSRGATPRASPGAGRRALSRASLLGSVPRLPSASLRVSRALRARPLSAPGALRAASRKQQGRPLAPRGLSAPSGRRGPSRYAHALGVRGPVTSPWHGQRLESQAPRGSSKQPRGVSQPLTGVSPQLYRRSKSYAPPPGAWAQAQPYSPIGERGFSPMGERGYSPMGEPGYSPMGERGNLVDAADLGVVNEAQGPAIGQASPRPQPAGRRRASKSAPLDLPEDESLANAPEEGIAIEPDLGLLQPEPARRRLGPFPLVPPAAFPGAAPPLPLPLPPPPMLYRRPRGRRPKGAQPAAPAALAASPAPRRSRSASVSAEEKDTRLLARYLAETKHNEPGLRVEPSAIPYAGNGLWTGEDAVAKGEALAEYGGTRYRTPAERAYFHALYGEHLAPYSLTLESGDILDTAPDTRALDHPRRLLKAQFANDCLWQTQRWAKLTGRPPPCAGNNAAFDTAGNRAFLVATENIPPRTEVLVAYGPDYWRQEATLAEVLFQFLLGQPNRERFWSTAELFEGSLDRVNSIWGATFRQRAIGKIGEALNHHAEDLVPQEGEEHAQRAAWFERKQVRESPEQFAAYTRLIDAGIVLAKKPRRRRRSVWVYRLAPPPAPPPAPRAQRAPSASPGKASSPLRAPSRSPPRPRRRGKQVGRRRQRPRAKRARR
jgi:hypothetical protein